MTSKKAVQMLDEFVRIKTAYIDDMANPHSSWNTGWESIRMLAKEMIYETSQEIEVLELIRQELVLNCKHPPEMHDVCKGQKYCMDCKWTFNPFFL